MVDFNVGFTEANMVAFCNEYKLKALNKEPTCFKNYMSPSCIDLFLTNCRKSFESTLTIETGLSDFYKLIVTRRVTRNFLGQGRFLGIRES